MLRIGKPSYNPLANVRLPQMSSVPGTQDLQFMLGKAQRNWRSAVELPFKYSDSSYLFILTVKCDMGSGEPCWMLYRNDPGGSSMIWSFVSLDVHLLRNLVHTECAAAAGAGELSEEVWIPDPATADAMALSDSRVIDVFSATAPASGEGDGQLTFNTPLTREDASLEGDLARLQVPTLLQSIQMEKMTGRLEFQRAGQTGDVFFDEGALWHASTVEATGDEAVLELLTWQDGNFHFYEGERFLHQTTKRRLDSLLMEGITLLDQWVYLVASGIRKTSYLVRKQPDISDSDFSMSLLDRAGGELSDLKELYERIDGKSTLDQVLARHQMPKSQWVPMLYNLVSRDLVAAADSLPASGPKMPEAMVIEESVLDSVTKALSRSETGILSYPALLYLLTQEFYRFKRGGQPFSLVVFDMCATDSRQPNGVRALPIQSLREMAIRIRSAKRDLDSLAHFETLDFALLLPHTDIEGASTLVRRLERLISGDPLMNTIHAHQIIGYFGIAAVPEDCDEPGVLLAAARKAKELAKQSNKPLMCFRDRGSLDS
jgi:GGDEF domain-containing protein